MISGCTKNEPHNCILRLIKFTAVFLIVISLFLVSSCASPIIVEPIKLSTTYTSYSEAHAEKLDLSTSSELQMIDVTLVDDQVTVLLGSSDEYVFAYFDKIGNNTGYSEPIPNNESDIYYHMFQGNDNEILIASGSYVSDPDTDEASYNDITVAAYAQDGTSLGVKCKIENDFGPEKPYVETDSAGNLYVKAGKTVTSYNATGDLQLKKEFNDSGDIFIIGNTPVTREGISLYALTTDKTDSAIINNLTQLGSDTLFESCNDGLFAYNTAGIFAYDFSQKQLIAVLGWNNTDLGFNRNNCRIHILAKDVFVAEKTSNQGTWELYLLLPGSEPNLTEKQVITIAGIGIDQMSYMNTLLDRFNNENSQYTLQIHDYLSESAGDLDKGKTLMNLDMLTDNASDIYMYSSDDIDIGLADIFLDLNTLIDNDSSFSKDEYFWNILSAGENGGHLDRICTAFYLGVLMAPQNIVGNISSWTIDDFNSIDNSLPQDLTMLNAGVTQTNFFASLLASSYYQFVDPTSGELDLENDNFYKMLDFAGKYAGYKDGSEVSMISKEACLRVCGIQRFSDYADVIESADPISLFGYPTDNNGEIKAKTNYYFSIESNSTNKDGAWEVIKFLLSDEMEKAYMQDSEGGYYGLPVNRESMNWQIDQLLHPDSSLGETPVTQETADSFLNLIEGIHSQSTYNYSVMNIAMEEIPAYYLGQKSAEDVAKILENRISITLQE